MIMDKIRRRSLERTPFCAGLDLREDQIPAELKNSGLTKAEMFSAYAKEAIDAAKEYASCFKPQIACYEALGLEGMKAYSQILQYLRQLGEISIGDIKRGDIGSTADLYAKAHFTGDFEADTVTLNPYMGKDAISPYLSYAQQGKGAFVLAKTSNPSSRDFQDRLMEGSPLYLHALRSIKKWGSDIQGDSQFSPLGAVIGANEIDAMAGIIEESKSLFLLIPGYGAQGAKLEDIAALIRQNKNGVINVSRGYTAGLAEEKDFRKALRQRAQKLADELKTCYQ